ncbi:alpha-galactosidase [bacterium]|nr:alpha-galactosidase [bacterium]
MQYLKLVLLFLSPLTLATTTSNFFRKGVANIRYDKGENTWTLSNLRLERVIVFKNGGLFTTSLKDKITSTQFVAEPSPEGYFGFFSPDKTVHIMRGWRMSETKPPEGWQSAEFDDSDWKEINLPFRVEEDNKVWWLRKRLSLAENESYFLEFHRAIDDEALIYIDGKLIREVKSDEAPWTKDIAIRIPAGKVLAIELRGHGKPNGIYGQVSITPMRDVYTLDLSKDWDLRGYKINSNKDGKELIISLSGKGTNRGGAVDVHYQVYQGDEPWIVKWFELKRSGISETLLPREIVLDEIRLPKADYQVRGFPGTSKAVWAGGKGIIGGVGSILGNSDFAEYKFQLRWLYDDVVKRELTTPKAIIAVFQGDGANGAFIYQLYMSHHYVRATPYSIPPIYNTWFGYYHNVNEKLCERIIPIAKELGCEYFVIDDGWQKNNGDDIYGDWIVDENKFPKGLAYIKKLCEEHGLRFGIWFAPIMAAPGSQVVREHPEWVVKRDGEIAHEWGSRYGMCLGSDYLDSIKERMLKYVKQGVEFFKCDDGLLEAGCTQPNHKHLPGYSLASQWKGWKEFCDSVREINPKFVIDRGWEGGPEVCDVNDEGWFGDWEIGYDPNRQRVVRWWYKNADIYRQTLWNLTFVRPPFTIAWETPCHLPIGQEDINALEYHFTSIGAYICNVEVHGRLDEMTEREKEVIKKWVKWNKENRDWLAFAQPILDRPWEPRDPNAKPHIDGVMHLRPLHKGKYGYICLWNPGEEQDKAVIEFVPKNYLIDVDFKTLEIKSIKDGRKVEWKREGDKLRIEITMPPLSWEILELRKS